MFVLPRVKETENTVECEMRDVYYILHCVYELLTDYDNYIEYLI